MVVSRRLRNASTLLRQASRTAFHSACLRDPFDKSRALTLKEIGDHLGHRDVDATRIYAKVDLVRLREVARL